MGSNGNYPPLQPDGNSKQLPPSAYIGEFSELEDDSFDLSQILTIARRRMLLIAGVAIAITSGVAAKVLKEVNIYEGKFQLLVEPPSRQDDKIKQLSQVLDKSGGDKLQGVDYETQIQVLKSPQVMSPILKKIQARYPDITEEDFREKLTISRMAETKIIEVRYQDSDPDKIKFVLEQIVDAYIKYSAQEQQNTVKQGLTFVNEQTDILQNRVNTLQQNLQDFRQKYNIIDPQTQGQLLTTRVGEIVKQRQDTISQLGEAEKLYSELKNQLAELGVSPQQAVTASALSEAPRYQKSLDKLAEIENKIAIESGRFTEDSPTIKALREQQSQLKPIVEQEAAIAVGRVGSGVPQNAPSLASPSSLRLELTKQMVETANQKQVLQVRRNAIAQAETNLSQQLKNLAAVSRQYTDLQRELTVATESLNRFLALRESLQIERAQKTRPWQQLNKPQRPLLPISPNIPRGIILGTVAGLLAGVGAALLAEKLDTVFHSPEELQEGSGLPILGTIPFEKSLKGRFLSETARRALPSAELTAIEINNNSRSYMASPFSEAFRSLFTNLQFISPDQPIRSLVISSSVPAEGKSTVATFLAQAAAAMGQRVLLVDADLRRPQVHVRNDLPNVWGLSNVISSEINVDDVIQHSPLEDNLYILTAGQIPPDPTRLLSSQKMHNLVQYFQETFDLVIFDAPPLLGLADARLLEAHTDGIALVVGLNKTDKAVLTQVLYGLKMSRARVFGVIANGVKNYAAGSEDYYQRYYTEAKHHKLKVSN
ncbi:MAG: polysaccharide biosynthesis tyrosine autokinase [Coleofasciculaceae cyanobacterium]